MTIYGHPETSEDVEQFLAKEACVPLFRVTDGRYVFCLRDVVDRQSLAFMAIALRCLAIAGELKLQFVKGSPHPSDHYLYVTVNK